MRIKDIGFCVVAVLILGLALVLSSSAASSELAAKVNGVSIKNITLDTAVDNFIENRKMLGMGVKDEDKPQLRKVILEELISAELLYQESQKAGLGDLTKEVAAQFENIKKGFKTEAEFKKILKDRGISEKTLKNDIKKGVYIKAFLDKNIYSGIAVSEDEKKQEYEKNKDKLDMPERLRASHILIRVNKDASDADKENAKTKITSLRERALSGEDFAILARENSQDTSASAGGDIGYFAKGEMVEPFEKAAFDMEVGGISNVVETSFGYHLIKLTDKTAAHKLSYEEVEADIARFLMNKKRDTKTKEFIDVLKAKAKMEVY